MDPLEGTGFSLVCPSGASYIHKIVAKILAFHLRHNAPLNLDLHQFINRCNIALPQSLLALPPITAEKESTTSSFREIGSDTRPPSQPSQACAEIRMSNKFADSVNEFRESWLHTSLEGFLQDVELVQTQSHRDLGQYLLSLRLYLRQQLRRIQQIRGGFSFWVSVQVKYRHPTKSVTDMSPPFLHTG